MNHTEKDTLSAHFVTSDVSPFGNLGILEETLKLTVAVNRRALAVSLFEDAHLLLIPDHSSSALSDLRSSSHVSFHKLLTNLLEIFGLYRSVKSKIINRNRGIETLSQLLAKIKAAIQQSKQQTKQEE